MVRTFTRSLSRCLAAPAVVVLLCGTGVAAGAQRTAGLPVGARVRVHRPQAPTLLDGTLLRQDSAGLVLAVPGRAPGVASAVRVPRVDVRRVERYRGTLPEAEAFRRGARRGALAGAVVGGAVTYVAMLVERGRTCRDCLGRVPVVPAVTGLLLTGVSTLVGGEMGRARREQWQPVPWP